MGPRAPNETFMNFFLVSTGMFLGDRRDGFLKNDAFACASLRFTILVYLPTDVMQLPRYFKVLTCTSFPLFRNISAFCFPFLEHFMTLLYSLIIVMSHIRSAHNVYDH